MYKLKIKQARESKGITQRDIAKELNMTQQQYHKIENNMNVPGIDKIVMIAKYLNVSIEDLIQYK
jgi:transcriptional regulator with XRE-family HTH domain